MRKIVDNLITFEINCNIYPSCKKVSPFFEEVCSFHEIITSHQNMNRSSHQIEQ